MNKGKVALIGCGKLGALILFRLISSGAYKQNQIFISRRDAEKFVDLQSIFPECNFCEVNQAIENAEVIIIAVRPQDLDDLQKQLQGKLKNDQTILSVVTAKTTKLLSESFGIKNIVRCSTNILLEKGEAFSFWYAKSSVTSSHLALCEKIIDAWGPNRHCHHENELETAIVDSGSFVGLINTVLSAYIESMILRGRSREEATELVLSQTAAIASRGRLQNIAPDKIAAQVKTPGGITNAACVIYEKSGLAQIIHEGNLAADERVKELS